jgi:hypothetical protein
MLTVIGFAFYFLKTGNNILDWLFPVMLGLALFGMKLAAPSIPWFQLVLALGIVFFTSNVLDELALKANLLFFFAGKIVIPAVCVLGFGRYWVKRRYIPHWSNW